MALWIWTACHNAGPRGHTYGGGGGCSPSPASLCHMCLECQAWFVVEVILLAVLLPPIVPYKPGQEWAGQAPSEDWWGHGFASDEIIDPGSIPSTFYHPQEWGVVQGSGIILISHMKVGEQSCPRFLGSARVYVSACKYIYTCVSGQDACVLCVWGGYTQTHIYRTQVSRTYTHTCTPRPDI